MVKRNKFLQRVRYLLQEKLTYIYPAFKTCTHYFLSFFFLFSFSPNDNPSKTMRNVFYFI